MEASRAAKTVQYSSCCWGCCSWTCSSASGSSGWPSCEAGGEALAETIYCVGGPAASPAPSPLLRTVSLGCGGYQLRNNTPCKYRPTVRSQWTHTRRPLLLCAIKEQIALEWSSGFTKLFLLFRKEIFTEPISYFPTVKQ